MTQEIITITVEAGQMTARRKSRKSPSAARSLCGLS